MVRLRTRLSGEGALAQGRKVGAGGVTAPGLLDEKHAGQQVLVAELLEDRALQSHAIPHISPRAVVVCGLTQREATKTPQ